MGARLRIGGFTFSVAWLIAFGRELFIARSPGDSLAMLWEIISPVSLYLMLLVIGLGAALYFSFPWFGVVSPTIRLRTRAELIDRAMLALERKDAYEEMADGTRVLLGSSKSVLRELILVLEPLNIPHPLFSASPHLWGVFLSRLSAIAKRGSIARARRIWPDMEAEEAARQRGSDDG